MRFFRMLLLLFLFLGVSAAFAAPPSEKRVYALLALGDCDEACVEAAQLLAGDPHSLSAWKAYLKALGSQRDEHQLREAFERYLSQFPEEALSQEVLEAAGWAVIEKGADSSSPLVRLYACLGAVIGQDAKSVPIVRKVLRDPHPQTRAIALQLAANFRDALLQEEVFLLFSLEKNPVVRVEAIKALGKMKVKRAKKDLLEILLNRRASAEEQSAAMEALVHLLDTAAKESIEKLAGSSRSALKELACQVMCYTGAPECQELAVSLLGDRCSDVRQAAVQAVCLLRKQPGKDCRVADLLHPLLKDPDPYVSITAAWALTICGEERGKARFFHWLKHSDPEVRLFASAALAATGRFGSSVMKEQMAGSNDFFVKANLALGLIKGREQVEEAMPILRRVLASNEEKVMWKERGIFRYVAPSNVKIHPVIPNMPEAVNLSTRLELLNVLAVLGDPQAQGLARSFLQKKGAVCTALASAILLTECAEDSIEIVEGLLDDKEEKVRIQAALTLALWGKKEKSLVVLEDVYKDADRETKERILEAMGQVGNKSSVKFLAKALAEPSQTLRIIAASSLLKCLYN